MLIQLVLGAVLSALLLSAQTPAQMQTSQRARELMAAGRFAEAVPLYEQLVKQVPGNPGLLLNLGMAQHMSGDDRRAVAQFRAVLKLQPAAFPALAMLGAAQMRLGQPAAAIAPLQSALKLQPDSADVRRTLAEALLGTGRPTEAAAQYARLTEWNEGDPHAWYGLGRSYQAVALDAFAQLERTAEGSPQWLALIAESRLKAGQNSSAFYFFRQALEKVPEFSAAHRGLAAVYRNTGHAGWAGAAEARANQVKCVPGTAACLYEKGSYLRLLQSPARTPEALFWRAKAADALAQHAFGQLEQLGPSLPRHRFRADSHRAQGRYRDAAEELKMALEIAPDDFTLQRDLATNVYLSRDFAATEPLLRQLLNAQPDAADLHFLLGDALLQMQQTEQAIPLLAKAVRLDPKLVPAHSALGRALLQTGKPNEAIPHLKAALPMDEDGSLRYQLMRAYQGAGNTALAAQTLREYQELQKAQAAAKKELDAQAEITAPEPR